VKRLKIHIPSSLHEQHKIAHILSTIDDVIEKARTTITKYKDIKKGMMQELFTRGIDIATGKLRPVYQNAPELYKQTELGWIPREWEVIPLVDVASADPHSFTGGPFGSDLQTKHYTETGIRIIQLQNIGDGYFLDDYKIFTSKEKADSLFYCNIFPGDIIIAKMADPIARACIMPNFAERYLMASDGIRLHINGIKYNSIYLLEMINFPIFRNLAIQKSTGSTRARIGLTELRQLPIKIPKTKSEQTKIAEILISIEKRLVIEQLQLNKFGKLKQGLISALLTGKVRVSYEEEKIVKETENATT
jgi:type I restriction enzyme S subunit